MQQITPCLWFERNNTEEAIQFYISVFPNSKIVSIERYPEGVTEGPMAGMGGKILTAVFELNGQRFMALDGGPVWSFTGAVSFVINCESQDEVDHYWSKLTEGGDPAAQQCGWLKDKFGLSWQVVPTALPSLVMGPDKAGAARAMQAMLAMKKLDLPELQRAYNGQ